MNIDVVNQPGIRMPAQWEPHDAVWLAWPYDKISFGSLNELEGKIVNERLGKVEQRFTQIITELAKGERVNLLIRDAKQHPYKLENVRMLEADYADVWTRDYMPSFVIDGTKLTAVKWGYDAYGVKFPQLMKDNDVWDALNSKAKMNTVVPGILLEGGAIEVNGAGVLLTTEQCLLKRNPHMTKADYEKIFAEHLGIFKVIWLKAGLVGDHTDGHIDEVARFVSANKILCAYEDDSADPNYEILKANYETLQKDFEAIKLPMPRMRYNNGQKAPASYINFYIANSSVLIPSFRDPNDAKAFEIIKNLFPARRAVAIDSSDIVYGGGGIHCATREQPSIGG